MEMIPNTAVGIFKKANSANDDAPDLDIAISNLFFLHKKFSSKKNKLFSILLLS